jgi:NAD(P)-dependent dehydrogenase (short-subunit alcohol dehydrogenase family)
LAGGDSGYQAGGPAHPPRRLDHPHLGNGRRAPGPWCRPRLTGAIGEPQQIAAANLYLMENEFVTGTVLTVDGGFILTGN